DLSLIIRSASSSSKPSVALLICICAFTSSTERFLLFRSFSASLLQPIINSIPIPKSKKTDFLIIFSFYNYIITCKNRNELYFLVKKNIKFDKIIKILRNRLQIKSNLSYLILYI